MPQAKKRSTCLIDNHGSGAPSGVPEFFSGSVMNPAVSQPASPLVQLTVDTPYMVGPVHCYTGRLGGETVLFDTGPPTDLGRKFLADNVDLKNLRHIIITHCHVDHFGLAGWLEKNSGATVYLPYRDILKIRHHRDRLENLFSLLEELGFADGYLDRLKVYFRKSNIFSELPERFLVAEKEIPEKLGIEVLSCAGHSQSDLVYATRGCAVTGDTLLKGVFQSPLLDVDLENGGRFKNYEAYCESIIRLSGLGELEILPGHRKKIKSVDETILFYVSKVFDRLNRLKLHIDRLTVAQVIEQVFGNVLKDPFHIYLKTSEILFMKDFLEQPGLLKVSLEQINLFSEVEEKFLRAVA